MESLRSSYRAGGTRRLIDAIGRAFSRGDRLSSAFAEERDAAPPFHRMTLRAAEDAGQVPAELRRLAALDASQASDKKDLIGRCLYPAAVFTTAIVTVALVPGPGTSRSMSLIYAGVFAAVAAVVWTVWRGTLTGDHDHITSRVCGTFGTLKAVIRDAEYARFLRVFGHLYEAGVPVSTAAKTAADTVSYPEFAHRISTAIHVLDEGRSVAESLPEMPSIRPEIAATLTSSEFAGELGQALLDTADLSESHARDGRRAIVRVIATGLYMAAVGIVIHRVLSFYTGVFNLLR